MKKVRGLSLEPIEYAVAAIPRWRSFGIWDLRENYRLETKIWKSLRVRL